MLLGVLRIYWDLDNVKEWGDAIMENKTLTRLILHPVNEEIQNELRERTKDRVPKLTI